MHPLYPFTVAVCATSFSIVVGAQSYPVKPVRVVIAFPPGGPTDLVGRIIAAKLTD